MSSWRTVTASVCVALMIVGAISAWSLATKSSKAQTLLEEIGCEFGRIECQVNDLVECRCEEQWVETPEGQEKLLRTCQWELVGAWCDSGPSYIPPCTEAYEGAEHVFAGVRKECFCGVDDCYWREM